MIDNPITVTALISQVKTLLEGQFRTVCLIGEITNLSYSSAGHYYFSISDKDSSISAALFRGNAMRNPLIKKLQDGDKVILHGNMGVYAKRGTFQIIVTRIEKAGKGDFLAKFEALKKKLAGEGLFDPSIKKEIPRYPKRVAVITSIGGAALHDFNNVYKRRSIWMDILVVPAIVQGNTSPDSLRRALHQINQYQKQASVDKKLDVVVFTRGGGSLEDLWAFNDELLARDIFSCAIPCISAVGHQVDYTISDFVADLRCETPTAAAEVLTHHQTKLKEDLHHLVIRLKSEVRHLLAEIKEMLDRAHPREILNRILQNFLNVQKKLETLNISPRFYELTRIHEKQLFLDEMITRMKQMMLEWLREKTAQNEKSFELLRVLNPNNVLSRGYVYVRDENGQIIPSLSSYSKLRDKEHLSLKFHDGEGRALKD
ncbi:MAG: exodeoxyribonuclease VII large subunit [Epsilonproteobacteria bacterium]|nr:MAG: exodeoxyribonuclease VII large subunit [Campylobacterota bacterium]RLA66876.1 MAG: exodeoxyribonuclease VII large subunit [Campylobacterota bacterium]